MSKLTGHFLLINFIIRQPTVAVFALQLKRLTVLQKLIRSDETQPPILIMVCLWHSALCAAAC